MHLCSRKKAVYFPATKGQANVRPTAQPAGPIYEEVSPKEEIELNTNQAYGPLGLWRLLVGNILAGKMIGYYSIIIIVCLYSNFFQKNICNVKSYNYDYSYVYIHDLR